MAVLHTKTSLWKSLTSSQANIAHHLGIIVRLTPRHRQIRNSHSSKHNVNLKFLIWMCMSIYTYTFTSQTHHKILQPSQNLWRSYTRPHWRHETGYKDETNTSSRHKSWHERTLTRKISHHTTKPVTHRQNKQCQPVVTKPVKNTLMISESAVTKSVTNVHKSSNSAVTKSAKKEHRISESASCHIIWHGRRQYQ